MNAKKTIVVGVGGGIAAYKAATLCSLLVKLDYDVQVVMTEHATRFITPLTLQALTKNPVIIDTFDEPNASEIAHIAIADRAAAYVIAPATANVIAKLAHGLADDMVTTTALATTGPVFVAPAMNVHMLAHPAVQDNLETLRRRGVIVIEPGYGPLACGYTGKGRLPEPEDIVAVLRTALAQKNTLRGKRFVVTAGRTIEDIDPVRYISNSSSGKMGYAIARAAVMCGAEVTLISGPTSELAVPGVHMVYIRSTEDLLHAVQTHVEAADVLIAAAAPADFRPKDRLLTKWKKKRGVPTLELVATPDVLATVSARKRVNQVFVGFAAETEQAVAQSRDKLARKNLDLLVVNDVSLPDAGFAVDTNRVTFLHRDGGDEELPLLSKDEVAVEIVHRVESLLATVQGGDTANA